MAPETPPKGSLAARFRVCLPPITLFDPPNAGFADNADVTTPVMAEVELGSGLEEVEAF